jgi:tetratricopeptide (TPR) repeat protein
VRRCLLVAASLLLAACASPLEQGDRLYRQGDLRGALHAWRAVPERSDDHAVAQARLSELELDVEKLADRHQKRGAWFEDHGRLAEAILSYRLALELRPDDRVTLERVQRLSRSLATRKLRHRDAFELAFEKGDLATARREMTALRTLDPFDASRAGGERALDEAVGGEVNRRLRQGRRQFAAGDLAGAEAAFRSALDIEPGNESAQGNLAYLKTIRDIERKSGRSRAAVPPPALGAGDKEIRAEGFYRNALAAERSGDPYKALRYDLAAVKSDPGHRGAREHMTMLRLRLAPRVDGLIEGGRIAFGREDLYGALERWRLALLIDPENERARDWTQRAEHLLANLERLRAEPEVGSGVP